MAPPRTERDAALALDEADPLRAYHDRFAPTPDGLVYLDGNSLGRLPRDTATAVAQVIERQWGERLIRGWSEGWMELPTALGDRLGAALLGAAPGQVAVADSTTVCFYKCVAAALAARPGRTEIVTDVDNFPTDRYVLESLAAQFGMTIRWIKADPDAGPTPEEVAAVVGAPTALVTFSHVNYRSAYILDMAAIGDIRNGEGGRSAFLAPPYDAVGPFSLDELEARGRIAFGECLVMSRRRWQEDQVDLRFEAREKRRAFLFRLDFNDDDKEHREVLNLPMQGAIKPLEINAAFRRLAKTAHPDAGGSDERYRRIAAARDALLMQFGSVS